jgi:hypothetical protein
MRKMQRVGMDGGAGQAHDPSVLGTVIAEELAYRGIPRARLAEQFAVEGSTVSRWLSGETPLTVRQVVAIENMLEGLPRGAFFIRAGLVDLPSDTETALRTDSRVLPRYLDGVLDALESAIRRSAVARKGR